MKITHINILTIIICKLLSIVLFMNGEIYLGCMLSIYTIISIIITFETIMQEDKIYVT